MSGIYNFRLIIHSINFEILAFCKRKCNVLNKTIQKLMLYHYARL